MRLRRVAAAVVRYADRGIAGGVILQIGVRYADQGRIAGNLRAACLVASATTRLQRSRMLVEREAMFYLRLQRSRMFVETASHHQSGEPLSPGKAEPLRAAGRRSSI